MGIPRQQITAATASIDDTNAMLRGLTSPEPTYGAHSFTLLAPETTSQRKQIENNTYVLTKKFLCNPQKSFVRYKGNSL